jgi:hypothetical protein
MNNKLFDILGFIALTATSIHGYIFIINILIEYQKTLITFWELK